MRNKNINFKFMKVKEINQDFLRIFKIFKNFKINLINNQFFWKINYIKIKKKKKI